MASCMPTDNLSGENITIYKYAVNQFIPILETICKYAKKFMFGYDFI